MLRILLDDGDGFMEYVYASIDAASAAYNMPVDNSPRTGRGCEDSQLTSPRFFIGHFPMFLVSELLQRRSDTRTASEALMVVALTRVPLTRAFNAASARRK